MLKRKLHLLFFLFINAHCGFHTRYLNRESVPAFLSLFERAKERANHHINKSPDDKTLIRLLEPKNGNLIYEILNQNPAFVNDHQAEVRLGSLFSVLHIESYNLNGRTMHAYLKVSSNIPAASIFFTYSDIDTAFKTGFSNSKENRQIIPYINSDPNLVATQLVAREPHDFPQAQAASSYPTRVDPHTTATQGLPVERYTDADPKLSKKVDTQAQAASSNSRRFDTTDTQGLTVETHTGGSEKHPHIITASFEGSDYFRPRDTSAPTTNSQAPTRSFEDQSYHPASSQPPQSMPESRFDRKPEHHQTQPQTGHFGGRAEYPPYHTASSKPPKPSYPTSTGGVSQPPQLMWVSSQLSQAVPSYPSIVMKEPNSAFNPVMRRLANGTIIIYFPQDKTIDDSLAESFYSRLKRFQGKNHIIFAKTLEEFNSGKGKFGLGYFDQFFTPYLKEAI